MTPAEQRYRKLFEKWQDLQNTASSTCSCGGRNKVLQQISETETAMDATLAAIQRERRG